MICLPRAAVYFLPSARNPESVLTKWPEREPHPRRNFCDRENSTRGINTNQLLFPPPFFVSCLFIFCSFLFFLYIKEKKKKKIKRKPSYVGKNITMGGNKSLYILYTVEYKRIAPISIHAPAGAGGVSSCIRTLFLAGLKSWCCLCSDAHKGP